VSSLLSAFTSLLPLCAVLTGAAACSLIVDGEVAASEADASVDADAAPPASDAAAPDAAPVTIRYGGMNRDLGGGSNSGIDLVVGVPADTARGDLLVAALAADGGSLQDMYPTGSAWQPVAESAELYGPGFGVWWMEWDGQYQAYGFEVPPDTIGQAVVMRFTGHASQPIAAFAQLGGDSAAPTCPSIDAPANAVLLCLGAFRGDVTVTDAGLDGYQTIIMDGGTTITTGGGLREVSAAETSAEVSFSLGQSMRFRTMSVALAGSN
jgi:hypothetical protein